MSAWSRHLKKLRRSFERPSARLAARNADRDLVSGRGARWPEERPRAAMGAPGNAPAPAGRPALRERLSVRRHLPRPRGRRGAGAASCQHRGDEASSRGDLGCRCGRRACRADLRSRRLAHHAQPPRPRKHHADLASMRAPELNPVENIWQYLRANWLSNRVFETYDDIVDAACQAWQNLIAQPQTITSIGMRQWAHIGQSS